jgi:hypothetical protein
MIFVLVVRSLTHVSNTIYYQFNYRFQQVEMSMHHGTVEKFNILPILTCSLAPCVQILMNAGYITMSYRLYEIAQLNVHKDTLILFAMGNLICSPQ